MSDQGRRQITKVSCNKAFISPYTADRMFMPNHQKREMDAKTGKYSEKK